ncbi:MAG: LacI family DNA-binding transcriptional regulator [Verrucomicrobiae bacterium]|nr:LacI family DNA-binding transcriptional regulator [Verrucomicrobiae bacterium]
MEDIARALRLSKMTVSRALANRGNVAPETRRRVLQAAHQLNYHFNSIGRRLKTNRTGMLGVVTPLHSLSGTFYFTQVLRGIQDALSGSDYHLAYYDRDKFQDGKECARLCREKRVDGLIVIAPHRKDRLVRTLAGLDVPLIVVGSSGKDMNINSVDVDNYAGAAAMVRHLIDLGHRRIAFIRGPRQLSDAEQREQAFRDVMAERGYRIEPEWVLPGEYETRTAFHSTLKLLEASPRPTAIFAACDRMAMGVIDAAAIRKISVPDEVSVAGFDDSIESRQVEPLLTTVRQPMSRIGFRAAQHLVKLLAEPEETPVIQEKLKPRLVLRESTKPPLTDGATGERP